MLNTQRQQITISSVGQEEQPCALIDNYFPMPDLLLDASRQRPYTPDAGYYPGYRSVVPNQYMQFLYDTVINNFTELFGFEKKDVVSIDSQFSITDKKPEELHFLQKVPHFDAPGTIGIACVHYLYPPGSNYGGTSLYRHKSTGYEYVNASRMESYQAALKADVEKYGLPNPPEYINGDTDIYTRIVSHEAEFNRAIIYRGSSLHSGDINKDHSYSNDPQTGRLTVTSFITLNLT